MALTDRTVLRCTPEEKAAWEAAAKGADRKLADWIRVMLNSAATVQIGVVPDKRSREFWYGAPLESDNPTSGPMAPVDAVRHAGVKLSLPARAFKPDFKPPSSKKGRR